MILRQFSNEINEEILPLFKLKGAQYSVDAISFQNENTLISGDFNGSFIVWDIKTQKMASKIDVHLGTGIWALETMGNYLAKEDLPANSNQDLIITGSSNHTVSLCDTRASIIIFF